MALSPELLDAFNSPESFVRLLGLTCAPEWPPAEIDEAAVEWLRAARLAHPSDEGCLLRLAVLRTPRLLVGTAGFKGPPTPEGRMDVGYSIIESHQRQGLATEAVEGLMTWAFEDPRVRLVVGETYTHLPASIRVLEKNGFRFAGVGPGFMGEENVSRYERPKA